MVTRTTVLGLVAVVLVGFTSTASAVQNPDFPQTVIVNDVFDSQGLWPGLVNTSVTTGSPTPFEGSGAENVVATLFSVTTPGEQFVSAGVYIELSSGHIFNEQFDTGFGMLNPNDDPPTAGMIDQEADFAFDTWYSNGDPSSNDGGTATDTLGAAAFSVVVPTIGTQFTSGNLNPAQAPEYGQTKLNVGWADNSPSTVIDGASLDLLQVALTDNAEGFWEMNFRMGLNSQNIIVGGGSISSGQFVLPPSVIIPLPAAAWMGMALLGAIGVIRMRRRQNG
jgi:hypothetical protein